MTATQSHYDILEISKTAAEGDIKKAFYRLLRKYPPERKPQEYQRLREAYDTLSNPVARREYDSMSEFGSEIKSLREQAEELLRDDEPDFIVVLISTS